MVTTIRYQKNHSKHDKSKRRFQMVKSIQNFFYCEHQSNHNLGLIVLFTFKYSTSSEISSWSKSAMVSSSSIGSSSVGEFPVSSLAQNIEPGVDVSWLCTNVEDETGFISENRVKSLMSYFSGTAVFTRYFRRLWLLMYRWLKCFSQKYRGTFESTFSSTPPFMHQAKIKNRLSNCKKKLESHAS